MITKEDAAAAGQRIAEKTLIPIDVEFRVSQGSYAPPGRPEMRVLRVTTTFNAEPPYSSLEFSHFLENRQDLTPQSFELWLLGWVQGILAFNVAAEEHAAYEDAPQDMRIH